MIVGVIGGSGLYEIEGLKNLQRKKITTPFGKPSDEFVLGDLNGTTLVFLPRHGRGHIYTPSEINYRANIFGMKKLGVEYLISMSAVGSMKEHIPPGDVVIVDQFIDRTKGMRKHTYLEKGIVGHVSLAEPVCPDLSRITYEAAKKIAPNTHRGGTYLCMEGPQFSTKAESLLYRSWGVDVIGMTNVPECKLAREAELCYTSVAFSTDFDCWKEEEQAVSADKVLATIKKNVDTAKKIIKAVIPLIPKQRQCLCAEALKHAIVTDASQIPAKIKKDLYPLIGRYIS